MKFIEVDKGIKVLIDRTEIIEHTEEKPWIYVGIGKANYNMHHGNFKIEDSIDEKIALNDFEISKTEEGVKVTFSKKGLYKLTALFSDEAGRLTVRFLNSEQKINRLWLRLNAEKKEHIYGLGEQFSDFDLRGKNYPLWVSEQGVGRNKNTYVTFVADSMDKAGGDYYTTYFPEPTFVSSRKYYCHVHNSAYMDFDFSHEAFHELQIWDIPEKISFEAAENYVALLQKLTKLLGRQPELPEWVYEGVWLGVQGGTEVVLNKLENALEKGLKVSGIWAQDWEGIRLTSFGKRLMWNWQWNKELYPHLDAEIKKLKERGIRFLGYINPYVAIEGNLFKEASQKGYLAKNINGEDYLVEFGEFYAGIVDFTLQEAFEWYKGVIKNEMIAFGLSGWMADFGEYLPTDAVLNSKESAEILHNEWPRLWAEINREAVEEAGKSDEITFFMRAGYSGSQKYNTLLWAGDQNVDWSLDDGLASVIPAALSSGMTGFGLHHSDIGGYTTMFEMIRTKELFMRWAEMAAFTPVMRTHEGNRPQDNWQFDSDDETLYHFAKMSKIYTALAPYTKALVKENSETGAPVQRPLFIHYEEDERTYSIKYEYLYGRDILVAPVYESQKTTCKVYLPKDSWIHLWTGEEYEGGDVEVAAPLGEPAVFYRKNSIYKELFKQIGKLN